MRAVYLALASIACLAFSVSAQAAAPLSIAAMTPADGATIAYGTVPTFEVTTTGTVAAPTSIDTLYLEVSSQNVLGQDGTLANDYQLDNAFLTRSDANPAVFCTTFNYSPWTVKPGTYYWQINGGYVDTNVAFGGMQPVVSPVFTVIVAASAVPAPAPTPTITPVTTPVAPSGPDVSPVVSTPYRMTLADVAYDVPLVISNHDAAAGTPKRLCNRVTRLSFKCAVAWKDGLFQYAGILLVTDKGSGQPRSTFVGGRAKLTCLRVLATTTPKQKGVGQISLQKCVRRWHW